MTGVSARADLRPGERVRVWRRRMRLSRVDAARLLRRGRHWVEEVECGHRDPGGHEPPWHGPLSLAGHERCMIYRLRTGVTQAHIAGQMGVSRYWVNRMERGLVPSDDLVWWWEQ